MDYVNFRYKSSDIKEYKRRILEDGNCELFFKMNFFNDFSNENLVEGNVQTTGYKRLDLMENISAKETVDLITLIVRKMAESRDFICFLKIIK